MKRRGGIVINDVSGRCRSVMDWVNIKSRTGPEDSVADTGAKTTDEESEIEEKRAWTRLTHIVPLLQVRSLWPKT